MTTILIVDDQEDLRESLKIRLRKHGFAVVVGKNGFEAIELAEAERPAIILMDMNMPELDGWEASSRIKRNPELQSIPIVALTAYTLPGDEARAKTAGCEGYLTKPVDMAKLTDLIRELAQTEEAT